MTVSTGRRILMMERTPGRRGACARSLIAELEAAQKLAEVCEALLDERERASAPDREMVP